MRSVPGDPSGWLQSPVELDFEDPAIGEYLLCLDGGTKSMEDCNHPDGSP